MSGFSADWLALREPADHAAINAGLRRAVRNHFAGRDTLRIVDLGSGTGSNMRGLAPDLPAHEQHWHLVDYDAGLLEKAATSPPRADGAAVRITTHRIDLSQASLAPLLADADIVTASALFDLVSPEAIERMASQIAARRLPFYTVLTYDGLAAWLPEHPGNTAMRELFNQHQQSDKGFGTAAGPTATDVLEMAFSAHGYSVQRGSSPWILKPASAELRRAVDTGWANAVRETGAMPDKEIAAWLTARDDTEAAMTIVGHEDLLALPSG